MPVFKRKPTTSASEISTPESTSAVPPEQEDFRQYLRDLAVSAVQVLIEQVMREELEQCIGASWGEITPNRRGYRNGSYTRDLVTPTGRIEDLNVPRDREGVFHSQVFERYSRYEPEVAEALTQMFVSGTSTHKVGEVAQTLMGVAPSASAKPDFSLQKPQQERWVAVLSDGVQETVITASSIPSRPLLPLLWAVRLLLLGISDAKCSWWNEPGEYRWLFTRQGEQILIHIVWFKDVANWSDEKGETVLRMEYDLLAFAKRLSHQLGQLRYQENDKTVPLQDHQNLQEAIREFEHIKNGKQA